MLEQLSAPFPPSAIHWRAQQLTNAGDKALALAYIDARDVMRRLDTVAGPMNWQDCYTETARGRVVCTLSIRDPETGQWISKSDGAGDTDVEGEKGGLSDAFKRAAVKWGIGRYLYDVEPVYAPCETWTPQNGGKAKWSKWKPEAARMFAAALDKAARATFTAAPPVEQPATITDAQLGELEQLFDHLNVPVAEFLKVAKIERLNILPANWFDRARKWVNDRALEGRKAA